MGQFSNSFQKHFSYLCEYAIRFDLSCSFCEYPFIFHCLHCSPSCFDPDSLLLAHLSLGISWIYCISANKSFSSPKTSSRKPYTSSKQQERQKHSVETTINFSSIKLRVSSAAVFHLRCHGFLHLCGIAGYSSALGVLRANLRWRYEHRRRLRACQIGARWLLRGCSGAYSRCGIVVGTV